MSSLIKSEDFLMQNMQFLLEIMHILMYNNINILHSIGEIIYDTKNGT